jgi:peptide deformylase
MAIRDILIWPHPLLKKRSDKAPVGASLHTPAAGMLFADLIDTVLMAGGLGLSAIQIGVPLRVLVTNFANTPEIWVNPEIIWRSEKKLFSEEGCLSLPGIYEKVWRHQAVVVEGFDEAGGYKRKQVSDYSARVFQHEIDHFNGIVYPDRMDPGARDRIRRKLMKKKVAA